MSENIVSDDDDIKNVGVGLEKVSKIKDIQDNINEKYEKDIKRSAGLNEESPDEGQENESDESSDEGGE